MSRPRALKQSSGSAVWGFNLIEAAIVLGVIGLVIGGIWVAASAAREKQAVNEFTSTILNVANEMRNTIGCTNIPPGGDLQGYLYNSYINAKGLWWPGTNGQPPIWGTHPGTFNRIDGGVYAGLGGFTVADQAAKTFFIWHTVPRQSVPLATQVFQSVARAAFQQNILLRAGCDDDNAGNHRRVDYRNKGAVTSTTCPPVTATNGYGVSLRFEFFFCETR